MKQSILVLAVVITVATISCVNRSQSGTVLTTSSTNKTYAFELTGNKYAPSECCIRNEVRFNLSKNGQPMVGNAYVDSYDHWDSDFAGMYPEYKWESDSVLRFGLNVEESDDNLDSLSILNATDKIVKYLQITSGDMLFVFEMPAQSKMKIQVPHQKYTSWIYADGEFTDGLKPKGNGANFFHKDEINEPLRYCLTVSDDALKVESPVMDGYIGEKEPNIPSAQNCDL